jgi:N4-(beta-N-acetylglucosaminyl)-L-asparaginase
VAKADMVTDDDSAEGVTMTTRRRLLLGAGAGLAALGRAQLGLAAAAGSDAKAKSASGTSSPGRKPLVVSTWRHGLPSNVAAWRVLQRGGRALDAVEKGVMVAEADPEVMSVGYGGRPDRDGHVTLDACVMDQHGNAGAVACLEGIMHPVAVARRVMEKTPHVMLVGAGAAQFAHAEGFRKQDLLTEASRAEWREWLKTAEYRPWSGAARDVTAAPAAASHDTISMLAIDRGGNLSGSCTTSGLAYKMHGRVGDSPIIGAALFVDNQVGAACATGVGEEVMKTVGSFLIVELMRQGKSPTEACREAVHRIVEKNPNWRKVQVGYLAIDRAGHVGAFSIHDGFQFAVMDETGNQLIDADGWDRS